MRKDTIDVCRIPILRAYNITKAPVSAEEHKAIAGYVLDGAIPGSGKPFDWELNQKLPFDRTGRLFLLAGGLNEDNVAEGIPVSYTHLDVYKRQASDPNRRDPDYHIRCPNAWNEWTGTDFRDS